MIYDAEGAEASDGPRARSPVTAYYARLTQALIAALTAPMAEGMLYKVDMRLRPSGRQGPVATSLAAFRRYQAEEAWTWEHLALTRARVVAGPPALGGARRRGDRRGRSPAPHDAGKVLADAADMRRRLAEAHEAAAANPWEVKLGPGADDGHRAPRPGRRADPRPRRRSAARGAMLDRLGALGWIAGRRRRRARRARSTGSATLQQIGRLASDHTIDPAEGGDGLVRLVLAATGEPDLDALRRRLAAEAARAAPRSSPRGWPRP